MVIENDPKKVGKSIKRSRLAFVFCLIVVLLCVAVFIFTLTRPDMLQIVSISYILNSVTFFIISLQFWTKFQEFRMFHRTNHHLYLAKEGVDLNYGRTQTSIPWSEIETFHFGRIGRTITIVLNQDAPYAKRRHILYDVYDMDLDALHVKLRQYWIAGRGKRVE